MFFKTGLFSPTHSLINPFIAAMYSEARRHTGRSYMGNSTDRVKAVIPLSTVLQKSVAVHVNLLCTLYPHMAAGCDAVLISVSFLCANH